MQRFTRRTIRRLVRHPSPAVESPQPANASPATLRTAFDTWCALWFWPLDRLEALPTPAELAAPSPAARQIVRALARTHRFFHWELAFPDVVGPAHPGFDAILGNPPWETQKPNSKEFFSNHDPLTARICGKKRSPARRSCSQKTRTSRRTGFATRAASTITATSCVTAHRPPAPRIRHPRSKPARPSPFVIKAPPTETPTSSSSSNPTLCYAPGASLGWWYPAASTPTTAPGTCGPCCSTSAGGAGSMGLRTGASCSTFTGASSSASGAEKARPTKSRLVSCGMPR